MEGLGETSNVRNADDYKESSTEEPSAAAVPEPSFDELLELSMGINPDPEELGSAIIPRTGNSLQLLRPSIAGKRESTEQDKQAANWVKLKTLMRGKNLLEPMDPLLGIKEFGKVHPDISRILALNFGIQQLNSLQRCASQHVFRGRNCTIVGGATEKRGKSLAYLIPVVSLAIRDALSLKTGWRAADVLKKSRKGTKQTGKVGPVGLFICGSYQSGEKIRRHLEYLASGTVFVTCLSNGMESNKDIRAKLQKNPEFLVVTAEFALELFQKWFDHFRFERLRFLVFDDFHLLFDMHDKQIRELIRVVDHHIEKRGMSDVVQTIFCGQEWNYRIASAYVKTAENSVLCIGAPMEAIKYGGVRVKVDLLHTHEKLQTLGGLLDRHKNGERIIIFCRDEETIEECWRCCQIVGISVRKWTDTENGAESLKEILNWWTRSEPQDNIVIVTKDSSCQDLEIRDARSIIHYDLPEGGQEAFGDRHMTMWGHFPDISNYETEGDAALFPKVHLTSHVFITDEDPDAHKIVLKLRKMNCSNFEISERLTNFAEQRMSAAADKLPICDRLLAIGKCCSSYCRSRHNFIPTDFEPQPNVPRTGRIELEILGVKDVNVYTAKVFSYYDVEPRKLRVKDYISYTNLGKSMKAKLDKYFSHAENLVPCSNLKIGMPCVVLYHNKDKLDYQNGAYVRGKVVEALLVDQFKNMVEVRVFCIDLGCYGVKSAKEVFVLPEEFQTQKSTCITLILSNLKPRADEASFSSYSKNRAKRALEGRLFTAKIALSLENTVWALPLLEHGKSPAGEWVVKSNARRDLIKTTRAADDNPAHMETIYRLCEEAGFSCDVYKTGHVFSDEFVSTHFVKGGKVEWAFLPIFREDDDTPLPKVLVRSVSGQFVYVQRLEFLKTLDNLNKELTKHVNTALLDEPKNYYDQIYEHYYDTEMVVAAQEQLGDSWNRAYITKMYKTREGIKYDVFFVDFGDLITEATAKQLYPIPCKFVDCLPFQSIAIRSYFVLPTTQERRQEDPNRKREEFLHRLLMIPGCKTIDIAVLEETFFMARYISFSRCYDVFAMIEDKELGEHLVDEGLAVHLRDEQMQDFKTKMVNRFNRLVNQNISCDSPHETSDDSDEFELFCGEDDSKAHEALLDFGCSKEMIDSLANVPTAAANTRTGQPKPSTSQAGLSPTETTHTNNFNTTSKDESAVTAVKRPPKPVKANSGVIRPKIAWLQDTESTTIRIYVRDSQKYSFNVSLNHRHVTFATKSKGTNVIRFGFQLNLYGKVDLDFTMTSNGPYHSVKLIKVSENIFWERLTYEENEYPGITYVETELDDGDSDCYGDSHATRLTLIGPLFLKKIRQFQAKKRRSAPDYVSVDGSGSGDEAEAVLSDAEDD